MKKLLNLLLLIAPAILLAQPSPSTPPTKIAAGAGIVVSTNGVNNFTISAGGTNSALTNLVVRQLNGNALTVNTNVLLVATNYVGIGTTAPLRPLHVGNYNAAGRADTKILVSAEMNNVNGSGSSHGFADASLISRSGGIGYNSFDANANIGGGVDYDHYAAFQSSPANVSVGVMNDYFGHYDVFNIQGGVLKNDYGFYKATGALYNGARVTNIYGIYIAPQTNGTSKNYGVYVAANSNYFGGRLDIAGNVVPNADGTYNSGATGSRWFNSYSYNFIGSTFSGSTVKANTFKDASFGEVTAFTFDGTLTKFAIPINLAATAEPAAPASGITLFVVNDGGKMVLKCKAPGGDVGTLYTEP